MHKIGLNDINPVMLSDSEDELQSGPLPEPITGMEVDILSGPLEITESVPLELPEKEGNAGCHELALMPEEQSQEICEPADSPENGWDQMTILDSDPDDDINLNRKRSKKFVIEDTTDEESEDEILPSDLALIDDSEPAETNYAAIQNFLRHKDDLEFEQAIRKKLKTVALEDTEIQGPLELQDGESSTTEISDFRQKRKRVKAWKMQNHNRKIAKRRKILFD